jgi:hypothetical protein
LLPVLSLYTPLRRANLSCFAAVAVLFLFPCSQVHALELTNAPSWFRMLMLGASLWIWQMVLWQRIGESAWCVHESRFAPAESS